MKRCPGVSVCLRSPENPSLTCLPQPQWKGNCLLVTTTPSAPCPRQCHGNCDLLMQCEQPSPLSITTNWVQKHKPLKRSPREWRMLCELGEDSKHSFCSHLRCLLSCFPGQPPIQPQHPQPHLPSLLSQLLLHTDALSPSTLPDPRFTLLHLPPSFTWQLGSESPKDVLCSHLKLLFQQNLPHQHAPLSRSPALYLCSVAS